MAHVRERSQGRLECFGFEQLEGQKSTHDRERLWGGAGLGKVYANFEMHVRHPNGDIKWAVGYMSLEFRQWI